MIGDRLISLLAFEDTSVRLAKEVEFMLHSTALSDRAVRRTGLPPTLVSGWFGTQFWQCYGYY